MLIHEYVILIGIVVLSSGLHCSNVGPLRPVSLPTTRGSQPNVKRCGWVVAVNKTRTNGKHCRCWCLYQYNTGANRIGTKDGRSFTFCCGRLLPSLYFRNASSVFTVNKDVSTIRDQFSDALLSSSENNEFNELLRKRFHVRKRKHLSLGPEKEYELCCGLKRKSLSRIEKSLLRSKRSTDSRPELVYTFIEQAVQPGAQVSLKCSAIGDPPPRFRWTLDGLPIPSHHGATITESRESSPVGGMGMNNNYILSTLTLSSARVEHGGRYECRATNAHGSVVHNARLNVYGPPYIRSMNPIKAVAGSEVLAWCPYYGFPIDSVKWEGGAGQDPRYQQVEGLLRIDNVDRSRDQGSWTCSVQTPGGELARREVQMTVVSPPVLAPIISLPGLKAGERTQLTCTVTSGDMPVYFSWLKDKMPISSTLQVEERTADFISMLIFKSLTAAHSGIYTCVVTNTAGKTNTSAELGIKVPPFWQVEPMDVAVLLNSSLTINCEARGHPTPNIYWTKVTVSGETSLGAVSDPVVLRNGSLRFESARTEHSGKYTCRADNGVPPSLSKTLAVHINEPARFESPSGNITAKLGDTIRLACVAKGDVPLSTTWSHSGRALPDSDYRMSISETRSTEGLRSELMIERTDRRDSGVYRCQASNPYGRSDHFVHLAVQEPPEPPANFKVIETSSRSVKLQWKRPYDGNSPVLGYILQYKKHDSSGEDGWKDADSHNVTVSARSSDQFSETDEATVTGLEPATPYLVRARTVTAQFASSNTRPVLALTSHEPPSRSPQSLRASAPRVATIELIWQPPSPISWNGELLGYTVWWWPSADGSVSGGANVGMEFATVRGQVAKYVIEGLDHYTRYSVSVRAFNSAGAGPATATINTLTQESVPSEGPRAVRCRAVSPQSLKVEWSPPSTHAHHGALLGYKLLYRPEHTVSWVEWEVREVGGPGGGGRGGAEVKRVGGVETVLLALSAHTNYTLQALAYTAAGDGVPAPPIHCTTQQDAPGPPAAVKVVPTSLTSLTVSWLPPTRPNGPVLYYTVFYRELGRDRPPQTTTVQAEETTVVGLGGSAELRSLNEGATYEAWVAAHSVVGEGEPTAPQPATTGSKAGAKIISFGLCVRVSCDTGVRLACAWRGEPAPRARWLRGDRPVTHDPRAHLTTHGHLAIHEVDSSTIGNYTCSARNSYGSEEITYKLDCASPPSAPVLTLEQSAHREIRLSWRSQHHNVAPPHGYTIWWSRIREDLSDSIEPSRGEEEKRIEVGSEATHVVLRALSCGARYSVRAVAHSRAGTSQMSAPLLVRTKPPVLVWEGGGTSQGQEEYAEAAVWSNSSSLALDARRAVKCGARLVRLQWRKADSAVSAWREADLTSLHHHREVVIENLAAGTWYALRLWTATELTRHQAVIYASTTTHSGEKLRRPVAFQSDMGSGSGVAISSSDTERVLGAVSLAFAALAALAVTALLFVLLARRSTLWPCGSGLIDEEVRRCSHSVPSTDKSVCPEQQNLRNCQHDYKHDKLSPDADVYEISPYATFSVGGEATLDHTLQFRTFGHRENEGPPHRPCRKHPQRHRDRNQDKHHSDCELQQLSRYEKVRPRHCASTSYCVPLPQQHHGGGGSGGGFSEVYAGDSSAESGPGSLSSRTHHEHS